MSVAISGKKKEYDPFGEEEMDQVRTAVTDIHQGRNAVGGAC